jgi:hypothetical protein
MTTFKKGQTVQRREGNRNTAPMELKSQIDVDYVTDLAARGYEYVVVKDVEDLDFELPTVEATGTTKPRVHVGGDVCTACEG